MRIDNYLFEEQKFSSRTKAKEAVERGEVLVNGHTVKPSYSVGESDIITFCDRKNDWKVLSRLLRGTH